VFVTAIAREASVASREGLAETCRAQSMLQTCHRRHVALECSPYQQSIIGDQFLGRSRWVTARRPRRFWRTTATTDVVICLES
jgi:hypothetical protein